jgi:hypothetical protein
MIQIQISLSANELKVESVVENMYKELRSTRTGKSSCHTRTIAYIKEKPCIDCQIVITYAPDVRNEGNEFAVHSFVKENATDTIEFDSQHGTIRNNIYYNTEVIKSKGKEYKIPRQHLMKHSYNLDISAFKAAKSAAEAVSLLRKT